MTSPCSTSSLKRYFFSPSQGFAHAKKSGTKLPEATTKPPNSTVHEATEGGRMFVVYRATGAARFWRRVPCCHLRPGRLCHDEFTPSTVADVSHKYWKFRGLHHDNVGNCSFEPVPGKLKSPMLMTEDDVERSQNRCPPCRARAAECLEHLSHTSSSGSCTKRQGGRAERIVALLLLNLPCSKKRKNQNLHEARDGEALPVEHLQADFWVLQPQVPQVPQVPQAAQVPGSPRLRSRKGLQGPGPWP